jgi:hypothetical protein
LSQSPAARGSRRDPKPKAAIARCSCIVAIAAAGVRPCAGRSAGHSPGRVRLSRSGGDQALRSNPVAASALTLRSLKEPPLHLLPAAPGISASILRAKRKVSHSVTATFNSFIVQVLAFPRFSPPPRSSPGREHFSLPVFLSSQGSVSSLLFSPRKCSTFPYLGLFRHHGDVSRYPLGIFPSTQHPVTTLLTRRDFDTLDDFFPILPHLSELRR